MVFSGFAAPRVGALGDAGAVAEEARERPSPGWFSTFKRKLMPNQPNSSLLVAALRLPDLVTPFKSMSRSLKKISIDTQPPAPEVPVAAVEVEDDATEPAVDEVTKEGEDHA